MPREQDLLAAFVELADTLIDDYDVVDFLDQLAARCSALLGADEAGIMLADSDGTLHYVASSSERMHLIELFELQHDEGPCLDAFHTGLAIHAALSPDAETRWPRFAPHAREVGFASIAAVPLRLRTDVIGALNIFSATPDPLSAEDQQVAQALADIATIGILHERALSTQSIVAGQLEAALQSRVVIEQAKGMLGERKHISADAAFIVLRTYSRNHNRLLSRTAQDIIDAPSAPTTSQNPSAARTPHDPLHDLETAIAPVGSTRAGMPGLGRLCRVFGPRLCARSWSSRAPCWAFTALWPAAVGGIYASALRIY